MAKKTFGIPLVLGLITEAPDVTETGAHTGQSGSDPFPCSFEEWQTLFAVDNDLDGDIDFDDYGIWWYEEGLGIDAWNEYNPGHPWDPNWADND